MELGPKFVEIAALVGDPARAMMLNALLDGRALTAGELASVAGITPQTASTHLGRLAEANLLTPDKQGRHRYFRLASAQVAHMLESIMAVSGAEPVGTQPQWRGGRDLRQARTCYDHLAGRLAVGIADSLSARSQVILGDDGGEVTADGMAFLDRLGVDLAPGRSRRIFCRPCLDWSERRPHLAGTVGAALATRLFDLRWVRRQPAGRAVVVTPLGKRQLIDAFALDAELFGP